MTAATLSTTRWAFAVVLAVAVVGGGYAALHPALAPRQSSDKQAWKEITWPFAIDQWGRGRAFKCRAADCGSNIDLYLRAKIGFCNCASAIDDEEVDRVADFDLIGGAHATLGVGRPIAVNGMNGRSRLYALGGTLQKAGSVLAVAFHDRCDMVIATAVVDSDDPAAHETAIFKFLNSDEVRHWTEATLGL
jgi:hypothetical protein